MQKNIAYSVPRYLIVLLVACGSDEGTRLAQPLSPDAAAEIAVDRFGPSATLMVRDGSNGLPAAGEPIDFDRAPFITHGLGPSGERASYYNFDVQSTEPAPIYVLFRDGDTEPVRDQLNIVDSVPGEPGYNDFWRVHRVTVPAAYEANAAASLDDVLAAGYSIEATETLVNCPVVPAGSSASRRLNGADVGTTRGWYRGQVVHYFNFSEDDLSGTRVPVASIYVAFNVNPDQMGGGPASGFRVEAGGEQTHNVLSALPGDPGYSPLWSVSPYDAADFESVRDLPSVLAADILARDVANVNCPVVQTGG